jgi:cytochrome P450
VAAIEESVQVRARQLVAAAAARGECDFVESFAAPLPLQIICDMLGVPAADERDVFDWTNVILGAGDPDFGGTWEALFAAAMAMYGYAQELGQDRLDHPRDDLVSTLMHADVEGQRLTPAEFGSFFILLAVAGNETTRNAISWGMKLLTDHPEQRRAWQDNFETKTPDAIEEIVRWASPVIHMRRLATEDTRVGEMEIPAGDKVVMWYWSANRDESVFDDGHRFDIARPNAKAQVGYGSGGPHFCLGANLARREITMMFREIFQWLPDLEITTEPARLLSPFINGIKRMECRFTPTEVPDL